MIITLILGFLVGILAAMALIDWINKDYNNAISKTVVVIYFYIY